MTEPKALKTNTLFLFTFFGILLFISGCEKDSKRDRSLENMEINCCPDVFSVPGWYSDSVYYDGDKIIRIDKYYLNNSQRNTQARFDYNGNEVKIFVKDFHWGSWRDVVYYTMSFKDGRISEVTNNNGRVQANYFYDNATLKYILYHRDAKTTDSISVEYFPDGNNIALASWHKLNQKLNKLEEASTVYFTYDNKNNPYRNSIHFLYNFYDAEEFSLDYFNRNNLKTVKSVDYDLHPNYIYNYDLRADYIYNENSYPVSIIFYNRLNQETDKNIITYHCGE